MYNFILKYFYSWYTLPLILLHESCHILVGYILGFKLLNKKLFKQKQPPIYNSYVIFEYNKNMWKWSLVLYAPLFLTLPIIFFFIHPIILYIGLYFLSTIMFYKGELLCIFLPSKADRNYKQKLEYYSYIINNSCEKEFNYYLKRNKLDELISQKHIFTEKEYFFEKKIKQPKKLII